MKNPLKTPFKYVFSIIPLGAILLTVNFKKPVNENKATATVNNQRTFLVALFRKVLCCSHKNLRL